MGNFLFDDILDTLLDVETRTTGRQGAKTYQLQKPNGFFSAPGEIEFELPGVKKEDIKIKTKIENIWLAITVEAKKKGKEILGRKVIRVEDVDIKGITSTYKDGLLTIKIPKSEKLKDSELEIKIE